MGTWGYSVFSNDLACDIRDEFRELIGDGLTAEDATRRLKTGYTSSLSEPEEWPVFWLALAAVQWQCGRLLEDVKRKAIVEIDSKETLEIWRESGPAAMKKRDAALAAFKKKLLSPQPKPTKIRKAFHNRTEWKIGHAVSYRLLSGKHVIMRMIELSEQRKSLIAIVDLCDWSGKKLPDAKAIAKLPRMHTKDFDGIMKELADEPIEARRWHEYSDGKFAVYSLKQGEYPAERLEVIATGLQFENAESAGAVYFGGWPELDKYLQTEFKLR